MDNFASMAGKVAIVTGAATGIGLACSRLLSAGGASVMLTDINFDRCQSAAAQLHEQGYTVACCEHDVTNEQHWHTAVDQCLTQLGGLDVLVNNAGVFMGGLLVENTLEEVRRVQEINVISVFLGMKTVTMEMKPGGRAGKGGSIINLSSVAGLKGVPGETAYGASKGAVRLYSKHAAMEYAALDYGIRVNSVHPALISTAMGSQVYQDIVDIGMAANINEAEDLINRITPMKRTGSTEEVASMVRFLASDAASYCTGGEFTVDGGATFG